MQILKMEEKVTENMMDIFTFICDKKWLSMSTVTGFKKYGPVV